MSDANERLVVSTGFAVLRVKPERILPYFLLYSIYSDHAVNQMVGMMEKGAYPSINQSDVSVLQIPLPPIDTQRAILVNLRREEELVAANRELVARMEAKIQAAMARVWGEEGEGKTITLLFNNFH